MSPEHLPFNWFDVLLLIVLIVGLKQGRKHGMSEELIGMLMWIAIAFGCSVAYKPLGDVIAQNSVFSLLSGYLMAYVGVALIITAVFIYVRRALGGKLLGSDVFGKTEFYLGMLAGIVRFSCILIAAAALLNARYYNSVEIKADQKYQNEVYGSNFFPTLYEIQSQVFERSLTGPWIRNQLGFLLIKPTAPEVKEFKQKEFSMP